MRVMVGPIQTASTDTSILSPVYTLQVNAVLLAICPLHDIMSRFQKLLYSSVISDLPCTCNGQIATVYLQ